MSWDIVIWADENAIDYVPSIWSNSDKTLYKYPCGLSEIKARQKIYECQDLLDNYKWFNASPKVCDIKNLKKAQELCSKGEYISNLEDDEEEIENVSYNKRQHNRKRDCDYDYECESDDSDQSDPQTTQNTVFEIPTVSMAEDGQQNQDAENVGEDEPVTLSLKRKQCNKILNECNNNETRLAMQKIKTPENMKNIKVQRRKHDMEDDEDIILSKRIHNERDKIFKIPDVPVQKCNKKSQDEEKFNIGKGKRIVPLQKTTYQISHKRKRIIDTNEDNEECNAEEREINISTSKEFQRISESFDEDTLPRGKKTKTTENVKMDVRREHIAENDKRTRILSHQDLFSREDDSSPLSFTSSSSTLTNYSVSNSKDFLQEILRNEVEIKYILKNIKKKIEEIDNVLKLKEVTCGEEERSVIINKLPCGTTEDIEALEVYINDSRHYSELVNFLYLLGGETETKTIYYIMKKLLTNNLALKYSALGKKHKLPFCSLKVYGALTAATRKRHPSATDEIIRKTVSLYLAQTKSRIPKN